MTDHLAKERKETDDLKAEAVRLGIQIPRDPGWWWYDDALAGMSTETRELIGDEFEYLTAFGKSATRRLIREELRRLKEEARQDITLEAATNPLDTNQVGRGHRLGFRRLGNFDRLIQGLINTLTEPYPPIKTIDIQIRVTIMHPFLRAIAL